MTRFQSGVELKIRLTDTGEDTVEVAWSDNLLIVLKQENSLWGNKL